LNGVPGILISTVNSVFLVFLELEMLQEVKVSPTSPMPLRRTTKLVTWLLAIILVIAGIAFLALLSVPAPMERWLQARVLLALQEHYQRDVQLKNLRVTLVPIFRATADDFVLPNRDGEGLPPFVTVRHLTAQAMPLELLRKPVHLSW
jgi:uncharacterized protein involved in outer membrane biogenesis